MIAIISSLNLRGDLDFAKETREPKTAIQRRFSVTIRNGQLDLHFRPKAGKVIVSAIEIA